MHSTVFELSNHPIPTNGQAPTGYLPDWFFSSVCEYTTRMSSAERETSITTLAEHFGDLCARSGNQLTFSPLVKRFYFKESYQYFTSAAKALSETDYETFAGIRPAPAFGLALNGILESYEDKRGFYIYSPDKGELVSLDNWLRSTDLSRPFFVGGTISYYC